MAGIGAPTGRFRRSDRIVDSRDFRRVLRRGRRRAHRDLVVVTLARSEGPSRASRAGAPIRRLEEPDGGATVAGSRLGITVSRKVGNAVCRNRFKRRVREWFRHRRSDLDPSVDLVVIARRSGAELGMAELDRRLSELLGLVAEGE